MIYKLRNAGGVESWFDKAQADALMAQDGWTVVETADEDAAPAEVSAPAPEPVSEPVSEPEADAPAAKKGKGR